MELIVDSTPASQAVHLAAKYSGLVASKAVRVLEFSERAHKALNLPKLPVLVSEDAKQGVLSQPSTILYLLSHKSRFSAALENGTAAGKAEVEQWLSFAAQRDYKVADQGSLQTLNKHLESRTFLAAANVTLADLALLPAVHGWIKAASGKDRLQLCNITRWFDHCQHLPGLVGALEALPQVAIDREGQSAAEAPGDKSGKKEKAGGKEGEKKPEAKLPESKPEVKKPDAAQAAGQAAAAAGAGKEVKEGKKEAVAPKEGEKKAKEPKEKKEKKPEPPKAPERPVEDVTRLEVRVGEIKKVWRHPEADKLYCEEIDVGEPQLRKIASGLVPYLAQDKMEGARVLVLCNLKPKALKGFESHGMVLCASNADKSTCELLKPPAGAKIGELVSWPGHQGEHDAVLNEKKNPFSKVQPDFKTSDAKVAMYKDAPFTTSAGPVTCDSVVGGSIS